MKQNKTGPGKKNTSHHPSFLISIDFKHPNLWSHLFDEDVLWYGKGQPLGLQLRKYLHEEHDGQEGSHIGAPKGRAAVSWCHCWFASGWSVPWALALSEGRPQEAHIIVGTTVQALHRLWEKQRRLQGSQNSSQGRRQPSSQPRSMRWMSQLPCSPWGFPGNWLMRTGRKMASLWELL